jgi:hypothetical protein
MPQYLPRATALTTPESQEISRMTRSIFSDMIFFRQLYLSSGFPQVGGGYPIKFARVSAERMQKTAWEAL